MSIPVAFIGAYWLLYLTGTQFEIMAGIGIPYAPLGRTMNGGLITSTFLTLFVVPLFYTYFDDLRGFLRLVYARATSRGVSGTL